MEANSSSRPKMSLFVIVYNTLYSLHTHPRDQTVHYFYLKVFYPLIDMTFLAELNLDQSNM